MPNRVGDSDVVIVGAGPAGLAAAAACKDLGVQAVLLEIGNSPEFRDRYAPQDIGEGVGGAGLFSDGKFSFYPSGTQLWKLQPLPSLITAYRWVSSVLERFDVEAPPFPILESNSSGNTAADGFQLKEYPSFRIPLSRRLELVQSLARNCEEIRTLVEVTGIKTESGRIVATARDGKDQTEWQVSGRAAIIATGRLGAIRLLPWLDGNTVFRRLEVGVRIEQTADSFFLRDIRGLDPKFIERDRSGIEWRTFCCCREGEVVSVLSNGVLSVSGRSDAEATKLSNVAFHVRFADRELGESLTPSVLSLIERKSSPFSIRVDQLGSDSTLNDVLDQNFGPQAAVELMRGLKKLQQEFDIRGPLTVYGPAVEGIGFYPRVDSGLRLGQAPLWLPGDVAGLFRGLTAAMVSGYFVGTECARYLCA